MPASSHSSSTQGVERLPSAANRAAGEARWSSQPSGRPCSFPSPPQLPLPSFSLSRSLSHAVHRKHLLPAPSRSVAAHGAPPPTGSGAPRPDPSIPAAAGPASPCASSAGAARPAVPCLRRALLLVLPLIFVREENKQGNRSR